METAASMPLTGIFIERGEEGWQTRRAAQLKPEEPPSSPLKAPRTCYLSKAHTAEAQKPKPLC